MLILTKLAIAVLVAFCLGFAHANDHDQAYINAAVADTATTWGAIASGAGYESNPIGFPAVTLAKVAVYQYAKSLPAEEGGELLDVTTAAMGGAAVNNLLVVLGAATGASVVAGLVAYFVIRNDQND
ncbi:hypothetical protein [Limnobacter sp.]|uniref:hypothetical protein n=1 Tax=Limnobacter sp. TaxID=2003368 RepID=UPI003511BEF3